MFMFKSRTAARNFKAGREGYVVKDLSKKAVKKWGEVYRWVVIVPASSLQSMRVFS